MESKSIARRHDLDALRAVAMLLGILLHATLSFIPSPYWPAQDINQSETWELYIAAIHGFRMPLFFLVSGFFTAMLWRKRGLKALLRHRTLRIALPLALAMITIVPAILIVSAWSNKHGTGPGQSEAVEPRESLWAAAAEGDLDAVRFYLDTEIDINQVDADFQLAPLGWAALFDRPEVVAELLDAGADVNVRAGDGGTPLHSAAFLGYAQTAEVLLAHGADPEVENHRGDTPIDSAAAPWEITRFIAGILKIEVDKETLMAGRATIVEQMTGEAPAPVQATEANEILQSLLMFLMFYPFFHHLWFLWHLCLFVVAFLVIAWGLEKVRPPRLPGWMVLSPIVLLWVVPLTMIPQAFMGRMGPTFGPDTTIAILPPPHVLGFYGIFFAFGALYYHYDDPKGKIGRWWWITLPFALICLYPIGIETTFGESAGGNLWDTAIPARWVSVFVQALYAWVMTFAFMGLFRRFCSGESKTFRYVSDSSYWLYLAHQPVVIFAQALVAKWQIPPLVKFGLICVACTAVLLASYHWLVRYTWVGTMLNGRRYRNGTAPPLPDVSPQLATITIPVEPDSTTGQDESPQA